MKKNELKSIEKELKNHIRNFNRAEYIIDICNDYKNGFIKNTEVAKYVSEDEATGIIVFNERTKLHHLREIFKISKIIDNLIKENLEKLEEEDFKKYLYYSKSFENIKDKCKDKDFSEVNY